VQRWNGLLFEGNGATSPPTWPLGPAARTGLQRLCLRPRRLHECDYNWKTFIEVYLEDYHVGPFHPGWAAFVTCDDLRWEFGRSIRCRRWA
jgi:choline monooxygenase